MAPVGCDHYFFFQAEDGIRDLTVTGVQTCALPIFAAESDCLVIAAPHTNATARIVDRRVLELLPQHAVVVNVSRGTLLDEGGLLDLQIGRASCRERV